MNARQRRADRKRWQYSVSIDDRRSFLNYDDMFDWCVANFGNTKASTNRWREKHGHFGTCWQFTDSAAATAFALRWK